MSYRNTLQADALEAGGEEATELPCRRGRAAGRRVGRLRRRWGRPDDGPGPQGRQRRRGRRDGDGGGRSSHRPGKPRRPPWNCWWTTTGSWSRACPVPDTVIANPNGTIGVQRKRASPRQRSPRRHGHRTDGRAGPGQRPNGQWQRPRATAPVNGTNGHQRRDPGAAAVARSPGRSSWPRNRRNPGAAAASRSPQARPCSSGR